MYVGFVNAVEPTAAVEVGMAEDDDDEEEPTMPPAVVVAVKECRGRATLMACREKGENMDGDNSASESLRMEVAVGG